MGRKECKNLPGVGMRLSVKFEGDACNVSVMPGHTYIQTDRQTDGRTHPDILDEEGVR